MKCLIDIQKLDLAINSLELLKNFSLKLQKGEKIGLTGPSGCGKTTLLNSIIENKTPESSSFEKFEINNQFNINYNPQKNGLLPWYDVRKNLQILTKRNASLSSNILKNFNINSKLNSYPNELSGGEYQRVSLAISLLSNPDLLIIDEPLTGVDIKLKYKILQELYLYLNTEYKSLLLVSHEIDILLFLCDKIIFVSKKNRKEISLAKKPKISKIKELSNNSFFTEKRKELISYIQEN